MERIYHPLLPAPKRNGVKVNERAATGALVTILAFLAAALTICLANMMSVYNKGVL